MKTHGINQFLFAVKDFLLYCGFYNEIRMENFA